MCTIFCGQIRILIVIKLVIFFHALNNFISKYLILLLNPYGNVDLCTISNFKISYITIKQADAYLRNARSFISKYLILLLNDNSIPLICSGIDYFTISYITIKQEGNVERIAELVLFQNILYYY